MDWRCTYTRDDVSAETWVPLSIPARAVRSTARSRIGRSAKCQLGCARSDARPTARPSRDRTRRAAARHHRRLGQRRGRTGRRRCHTANSSGHDRRPGPGRPEHNHRERVEPRYPQARANPRRRNRRLTAVRRRDRYGGVVVDAAGICDVRGQLAFLQKRGRFTHVGSSIDVVACCFRAPALPAQSMLWGEAAPSAAREGRRKGGEAPLRARSCRRSSASPPGTS